MFQLFQYFRIEASETCVDGWADGSRVRIGIRGSFQFLTKMFFHLDLPPASPSSQCLIYPYSKLALSGSTRVDSDFFLGSVSFQAEEGLFLVKERALKINAV